MQYVSVFFFAIVRRPTKPVWVAKEGTSALRENVGESVVDEGFTLVERKGQRSVQRPWKKMQKSKWNRIRRFFKAEWR